MTASQHVQLKLISKMAAQNRWYCTDTCLGRLYFIHGEL